MTIVRMPSSPSITWPSLCFPRWTARLPLREPLLLRPVWHLLLFPGLHHWGWTLADVPTLPCRRLWQWGWVVERYLLKMFPFLSSSWRTPCHRRCQLAKPPWQLSQQCQEARHNRSGEANDNLHRIHHFQNWVPFYLCLWPPNNHRRGRNNLDGEKLWQIPPSLYHKPDQHRPHLLYQQWHHYKTWLESQLECSDKRLVSTTY